MKQKQSYKTEQSNEMKQKKLEEKHGNLEIKVQLKLAKAQVNLGLN